MHYIYLHWKNVLDAREGLRYRLSVTASRPGIARADRARKGSFSSLLDQVLTDPGALDALVYAYEALPTADRLGMVRAIVQDARRPGPALASLLSVESDPTLRLRLGTLLRTHANLDMATLSGSDVRGTAVLRGVDEEGLAEALMISWNAHEIEQIDIKPSEGLSYSGEPTTREAVMERVAPMLWRHLRRGGALPPGVERFARYL